MPKMSEPSADDGLVGEVVDEDMGTNIVDEPCVASYNWSDSLITINIFQFHVSLLCFPDRKSVV